MPNTKEATTLVEETIDHIEPVLKGELEPGEPGTETDSTDQNVPESKAPMTDEELLADLTERRKSGTFPVHSMTFRKLQQLTSHITSKAEFTGPQEAYYVVIAQMELGGKLGEHGKVPGDKYDAPQVYEFRASTIEIIDFLLRKYKATGSKNAQEFLSFAMPVNNAIGLISNVDNKIKELTEKLAPKITTADNA